MRKNLQHVWVIWAQVFSGHFVARIPAHACLPRSMFLHIILIAEFILCYRPQAVAITFASTCLIVDPISQRTAPQISCVEAGRFLYCEQGWLGSPADMNHNRDLRWRVSAEVSSAPRVSVQQPREYNRMIVMAIASNRTSSVQTRMFHLASCLCSGIFTTV